MCDYTQVEYACGHLRYTVKAWCTKYQETQKRCPANVIAIEYRLDEKCGDCRDTATARGPSCSSSSSSSRSRYAKMYKSH